MKQTLLLPLLLVLTITSLFPTYAQMGFNSPAGVTPRRDIEIYTSNGFMVQKKYRIVPEDPANRVHIMSCVSNPPAITALAGILKDPSGDNSYTPGVSYSCTQVITLPSSASNNSVVGVEFVFDDLETDLFGDYVQINGYDGYGKEIYAGYLPTNPGRIVMPTYAATYSFTVTFVTDNDAVNGRGFALRWRALLHERSFETNPINPGNVLQLENSRFKAGFFNGVSIDASTAIGALNTAGRWASAIGYRNNASGQASTALGDDNQATGYGSIALGQQNNANGSYGITLGLRNTASGEAAVSMGRSNTASGAFSAALGLRSTASGFISTALGSDITASGVYSTALGTKVNTNNQRGAFIIGDSDPLFQGETTSGFPDEFVARFRNGYYLMTSGNTPATRTGVQIGAGQNAWATISDSTKKERFLLINHADLLHKIEGIKLTSWNYKGQRTIRHYGPMAQDFYAAFGHDGLGPIGCDTLIYSHDFAGVTFAGVQALIRENAQLRTELQQLRAGQQQTDARLRLLETALLGRRQKVAVRNR